MRHPSLPLQLHLPDATHSSQPNFLTAPWCVRTFHNSGYLHVLFPLPWNAFFPFPCLSNLPFATLFTCSLFWETAFSPDVIRDPVFCVFIPLLHYTSIGKCKCPCLFLDHELLSILNSLLPCLYPQHLIQRHSVHFITKWKYRWSGWEFLIPPGRHVGCFCNKCLTAWGSWISTEQDQVGQVHPRVSQFLFSPLISSTFIMPPDCPRLSFIPCTGAWTISQVTHFYPSQVRTSLSP